MRRLSTEGDARGLFARGLTRRFGGRTVLESVDIDVGPGQLACMEGPNGAGKTTLLRIFATVVSPDSGKAQVDGYDVGGQGGRVRERIGAAFVNERSLYWRLTGRENLRLFARTRGLRGKAADLEVESVLDALQLREFADRWVANLSAGQRQRLIIARASLGAPTCMLIDEPLRGLDDEAIATMISFLAGQKERGAAVLVVAPKLDELEAAADVLFRLRDARIAPVEQG